MTGRRGLTPTTAEDRRAAAGRAAAGRAEGAPAARRELRCSEPLPSAGWLAASRLRPHTLRVPEDAGMATGSLTTSTVTARRGRPRKADSEKLSPGRSAPYDGRCRRAHEEHEGLEGNA